MAILCQANLSVPLFQQLTFCLSHILVILTALQNFSLLLLFVTVISLLSLSTHFSNIPIWIFIHCCNCLCKITNDFYYPETLGYFLAFSDFPEHSPAVSCLLDFCETPLSRFSHFSCFAHSSISPVRSSSSTYTLNIGRDSGTVLVTNSPCTVFFP